MRGRVDVRTWLPLVVTVAAWVLVVYVTARLVTDTWADLVGLLFLVASPFLYRLITSSVRETHSRSERQRDVR